MNAKLLLTVLGLVQCALLGLSFAKEDDKVVPKITWETPRLMMPIKVEQTLLKWRNGETLPGELEGFSDGRLIWKTSLFEDPLRLKHQVLRRLDFKSKKVGTESEFRLTLIDGTHLHGELARSRAIKD